MACGPNFHIVNVGKIKIEKYQGKLYIHMKFLPGTREMNLQCMKILNREAQLGDYTIFYTASYVCVWLK
jgi:hypothetical protein